MPNTHEQIAVFIDRELSPEANRQRFIKVAKDSLAATLASGKASYHYTTAVDGHPGNVDEAQRVVTHTFSYVAEAAMFALGFLKSRVPVVSGKTAKSFWVSVNNIYYGPGTFNINTVVPPDAEIVIGNLVPQWRRIDTNYVGNRELRYRYPGDIDDCVRAVNRQFGNMFLSRRVYDYNFPGKYRAVNPPTRRSSVFQSPVVLIRPR